MQLHGTKIDLLIEIIFKTVGLPVGYINSVTLDISVNISASVYRFNCYEWIPHHLLNAILYNLILGLFKQLCYFIWYYTFMQNTIASMLQNGKIFVVVKLLFSALLFDHFCYFIAIHCKVTHWSPWTPCSATCGSTAAKSKHRSIIRHPSPGGKPCPRLVMTRTCRLGACDVVQPPVPNLGKFRKTMVHWFKNQSSLSAAVR